MRLYDQRRWRNGRREYLRDNPLCVMCRATGKVSAAQVVDHITPHNNDLNLFYAEGNWQALCKPCHDSKTAGRDGGFGNAKRKASELTPRPGCGADGWPLDRGHHWRK